MKPIVMAPRMPLHPGAINIPNFGVNIKLSWSGVSGWPSACAKVRAMTAEECWSGRSTNRLKKGGTGLSNHINATGNHAARSSLGPPKRRTNPVTYATATSEYGGRTIDQEGDN